MRQCCSADRRWGYAAVWFRFLLISSNIWLALLVSMWTWGNVPKDIHHWVCNTSHIWFSYLVELKKKCTAEVCLWLTASKRLDIRSSSSFLNISKKSRCLQTTMQSYNQTCSPDMLLICYLHDSVLVLQNVLHVPVQSFIVMGVEFVNDRLNAQHQKLITQMDPELQTGLKTHVIIKY